MDCSINLIRRQGDFAAPFQTFELRAGFLTVVELREKPNLANWSLQRKSFSENSNFVLFLAWAESLIPKVKLPEHLLQFHM
jgi:hypothetical protein